MQKYRDTDIRSFEFNDLQSSHVIKQDKLEAFNFKTLDGESLNRVKISDTEIRQERAFEKNNNFKIDGIVREYRGLSRQEQTDLEKRIQDEVNKRLEAAYQDAYQEGLEKGRAEGKQEAFEQEQQMLADKVDGFVSIISEVQGQSGKLIEKNRHETYEFIKRFTKWVLMKEVNDKVYLENLLEKLILELNARKNLIVKVGRANFQDMPEILKNVEARLGQLSNVRVEIVPELHHPGIILETENGLIDGSLEGVFRNIDKIFEQVINHE